MKGSNRDVIGNGILHSQDAIEAGFYKKMKYILIILLFVITNCTPKQLLKTTTEIHDRYYDSVSTEFRQIKDFEKIAYLLTHYSFLIDYKYKNLGLTTIVKIYDSLNNKDSFVLVEDTIYQSLKYVNIIDSIGLLTNLRVLKIHGYTTKSFVVPQSLNKLIKLEHLGIGFYLTDTTFPQNIVFPNLFSLNLSTIKTQNFPIVFYNWVNVERVSFDISRNDRHLFRKFIVGFANMKNMESIVFSVEYENDREVKLKDLDKYWRRDLRWAKRYLKKQKIEFEYF